MMGQESFLHQEQGGVGRRRETGMEGHGRCSGRDTSLAATSPQTLGKGRWEHPVTDPTNQTWGVSSALTYPGTQELPRSRHWLEMLFLLPKGCAGR